MVTAQFTTTDLDPARVMDDEEFYPEDEAMERPKFAGDAIWHMAVDQAQAAGYTGHAVYVAAADDLYDTYGYR